MKSFKYWIAYWSAMLAICTLNTYLYAGKLNNLGIQPREYTLAALVGIFLHPFLHRNYQHLISNSLLYLPLGFLIVLLGEDFREIFWKITLLSGLISFFLLPKNFLFVGSSGVIYGLWGYLITRGILALGYKQFRQEFANILLAITSVIIGGKLIFGMVPTVASNINWEGHIIGFLIGVFLAYRRYKSC